MDETAVYLKTDVHERWSQLQGYLGFDDTSEFAEHLLADYKSRHDITASMIAAYHPIDQKDSVVNGKRFKTELVTGESCDSANTSGKASPVPDIPSKESSLDKSSSRKRKHRSLLGLESVVQRLHQAKVGGRDESKADVKADDGWLLENAPGTPGAHSPRDRDVRAAGDAPSSPGGHERLSVEEYGYSSPRVIPESVDSRSNNMLSSEGLGVQHPSYTLRKLLEMPTVNASAELRRNAAELKERGVVINPAISMYSEAGHRGGPYDPLQHMQSDPNEPPAAQALESLIRMALVTKGDSKTGVPTEEELLRTMQAHGMTEAQRSALRGAADNSPALKNILQRGGNEKYIPRGLSVQDNSQGGRPGGDVYNMPSAAYALQHLAQMRGPENVPFVMNTTGQKLPKRTYKKRQKPGEKPRKKHKSGKKNSANPPTVKNLLDQKKEKVCPTKLKGRARGPKGVQKTKTKSKKKTKGDQGTEVKRGRKKNKLLIKVNTSMDVPGKVAGGVHPPPATISNACSAAQVNETIAGQESGQPQTFPSHIKNPQILKKLAEDAARASPHTPIAHTIQAPNIHPLQQASVCSHEPMSNPHHQRINNSTPQFPDVKSRSPSLSVSNSASEVMKLLASQNLSHRAPAEPVSMPPLGLSNPPPAPLIGQIPVTPPRKPIEEPSGGAAGIMKQLAQSATRDTSFTYPMFFSPMATGNSSNAFSLMKELITKGSS